MSDKDALLKDLDGEYELFFAQLLSLSEAEKTQKMLDDWAVRDIVVHVGSWFREMTPALERMARGERPVPEGVDYSNADAWNARFVAAAAGKSPGQVEADMHAAKEDFVQAVRALPDDRLAEGKTGRRIVFTTGIDHLKEHAGQIQAWRAETGAGRDL